MTVEEKINQVLAICEGMTGREYGLVMEALSLEWGKVAPPMLPRRDPPDPQVLLSEIMPKVIADLPDLGDDVENRHRPVT